MAYFLIFLGIILGVYALAYIFFSKHVENAEKRIINFFLLKVGKIPGLIEVMRPYVADESAFDSLIALHSDAMTRRFDSIYLLLEHNARIQAEFLFLMKLSFQIPELQKNSQFIYIRDYIMNYERDMKNDFSLFNTEASKWNTFVKIKNFTIIGLLLPGAHKDLI